MPLKKGKTKKIVQVNFEELLHSGYPKDQAYAIAKSKQRESGKKKPKRK